MINWFTPFVEFLSHWSPGSWFTMVISCFVLFGVIHWLGELIDV